MAKILLVEDDPLLVDIYKIKLETNKHEVFVVDRGDAALNAIRKERPDIVLLDIVLPNEDGWEILRSLKEEPSTKDIRVIILSNLGQKEEVEKGLQLGATHYLIKAHYTPTQVVEEVEKVLAESKPQEQEYNTTQTV